jgi:hypothetical protein
MAEVITVIEGRGNGARSRGMAREIKVAKLLRSEGWSCWTTKNDGLEHDDKKFSHGIVDVIAIKCRTSHQWVGVGATPYAAHPQTSTQTFIRCIQVKSTGTPYAKFGPRERSELLAEAERIGGAAELCWWPKHARQPTWIPAEEWPARRSRTAA